MQSLGEVIDGHAAQRPDAVAFFSGEEALRWQDYARRSDRLAAAWVESGLRPGDCVAVLLPDGPGVHVAFVAGEKAGVVVMGIGPRAGREEIRHLIATSGAVALLSRAEHRGLDLARCVEEWRREGLPLRHHFAVAGELAGSEPLARDGETLAPAVDRGALSARRLGVDDLFLLNSTSGTTGRPKCVMHVQRRWNHFHELAVDAGELHAGDVFLSAIPAPFGFGLWTAHFTPTLLGAPCVLLPAFDAEELVRRIELHRVTVLAAVSTQFTMMLASEAMRRCDLSSLRVLFTGGEAVPTERAVEFEERTGARVLQFYGSNETGALSRTTTRDAREVRLGSAGHVIEEMAVRLFDEAGRDVTASGRGQPGCRGPLTSAGYHGDAAANARLRTPDGWMLTGDIATLDADGVLRVIGRAGDFIIRGGKNISGPAVEQAVATHPAVALAAAVAMPDPVFGERVCVYAQLRAGEALELPALVEHLKARGVSVETLPERLEVVDELPRSSGGKIAKQVLRDDIARRIADETR